MKRLLFIYSLITVTGVVISSSCKKDDTINEVINPTNGKTTVVFNPNKTYGTVKDIDGNIYKTIVIGTQTWMAENLRTSKYRNGEPIQNVIDNSEWVSTLEGACCNYKNSINLDTIATFGKLYNRHAITDSRKIAPNGWHIATYSEWKEFTAYLGGENGAGDKLKEAGNIHWQDLNGATNESGFSAIPHGNRSPIDGTFNFNGYFGDWWCSPTIGESNNWCFGLVYFSNNASFGSNGAQTGYAIRCIKDN